MKLSESEILNTEQKTKTGEFISDALNFAYGATRHILASPIGLWKEICIDGAIPYGLSQIERTLPK